MENTKKILNDIHRFKFYRIKHSKLFLTAGTFLREISRSEIIPEALLVGVICGILAVLFKISVEELSNFITSQTQNIPLLKKLIVLPLVVAFGGLISGLLVYKIAPETKGSGIPYVKLTLARVGKKTRLRGILVKFFGGLAGIGSGLSLGREGPSVQLGAGAGAIVSKIFKVSGTRQNKLIAAGAGAAIAATFNAPIAAAIFVLEELLHIFTSEILFPVLIATISAASVARYFIGSSPAFTIPEIQMNSSLSFLPVFITIGIICGITGVLFSKLTLMNTKLFENYKKMPNWLKPAFAGLITGVIGVFLPYILGSGNLAIDHLLENKLGIGVILAIVLTKFFVTPFCFGSGAVGGIFLPILMIGSFIGYLTLNF